MSAHEAVFIVIAAIAVVSALNVILRRNPVHSAIFLALVILCLAGIFVLLNAEFIASIEVIIYAGAIIVLFLFTMMLLDVRAGMASRQLQLQAPVAIPVAILILACLVGVAVGTIQVAGQSASTISVAQAAQLGSVQNLGQALYSDFLLPFEVASLVLTVGLVGAIGLAGRGAEDVDEVERVAEAEDYVAEVKEDEGGELEPEEGLAAAGHHA